MADKKRKPKSKKSGTSELTGKKESIRRSVVKDDRPRSDDRHNDRPRSDDRHNDRPHSG